MKMKIVLGFVAFSGFILVALGALVAHHFTALLSVERIDWLKTGLQYQAYHTLAMLGIVALYWQRPQAALYRSALFFMLGIVLFCGSLYAFAFFPVKSLAYITPLGGICFLVGWLSLLVASWRITQ